MQGRYAVPISRASGTRCFAPQRPIFGSQRKSRPCNTSWLARRTPRSAGSAAAGAEEDPNPQLYDLIASQLAEHQARQAAADSAAAQQGRAEVDVLELLDRRGEGVEAKVSRSWTRAHASLTLEGDWRRPAPGEPLDRRAAATRRYMAKLAVHHEWHSLRSALLRRVFLCAAARQAALFPQPPVLRLRAANGPQDMLAGYQLGRDDLVQLAAAVLGADQLQACVERAVDQARAALLPPNAKQQQQQFRAVVTATESALELAQKSMALDAQLAVLYWMHLQQESGGGGDGNGDGSTRGDNSSAMSSAGLSPSAVAAKAAATNSPPRRVFYQQLRKRGAAAAGAGAAVRELLAASVLPAQAAADAARSLLAAGREQQGRVGSEVDGAYRQALMDALLVWAAGPHGTQWLQQQQQAAGSQGDATPPPALPAAVLAMSALSHFPGGPDFLYDKTTITASGANHMTPQLYVGRKGGKQF